MQHSEEEYALLEENYRKFLEIVAQYPRGPERKEAIRRLLEEILEKKRKREQRGIPSDANE